MTKSKRVNIALAIVIAIALWAYVVGEMDPSSTKKIDRIPISLLHTDVLAERGLAVSSMTAQELDIEVIGSRTALANLEPGDVTASIDLASAAKGENQAYITVRVPSGLTISKKSISNISVTVEALVSKPVSVKIVYSGAFAENEEGTTVAIENSEVEVSGAESIVKVVDSVRGTVDASRVGEAESENVCSLIPVNKEGNKVENVTLSRKSTKVTSVLSKTKTIDLTVPIKDNSSDGAKRSTNVPKKIIVVGRADSLKSITGISADAIDISNITKNTELVLTFSNLPEGISISEKNSSLVVKVSVNKLSEKTFAFAPDEIKLRGKSEELKYNLEKISILNLTISGDEDEIDKINKTDFELFIDVSKTEEGSQKLQISVSGKMESFAAVLDPQFINVEVSKK